MDIRRFRFTTKKRSPTQIENAQRMQARTKNLMLFIFSPNNNQTNRTNNLPMVDPFLLSLLIFFALLANGAVDWLKKAVDWLKKRNVPPTE